MFRNLPRYDRYAPNGSPWLGELPSHWLTQRTKSLLAERSQKGYPDEPLLAATQSHGVILKADYGTRTVTATKDLHLLKLVEVGDFVISLRSFQGGIERCHRRGIISPAYTVLTAKSAGYREYLTYLFKSKPFVDSLTLSVTGIREGQNIDYATLAVDRLPVPTCEEQAAIVKYLDHANARIDKAIAAKRRLVALLDEQKRAVAREYLSQEEWPSCPLGRIGRIGNGSTPSRSTPSYWDGSVPWLNSSVVNRESVDDADQFVTDKALVECHLPLVPAGSVLIGITGQGRTRGMSTILRMQATVNQHIAFITPQNDRASADFVNLALAVGYGELRRISDGSGGTKGALTLSDLKSFRIPLPPVAVQERLVSAVRAHTEESATAINRVQREILLLQEFRTRLVADVVTGQVDVRGVAAGLPDAPEAATDPTDESSDELSEVIEGADA